MNLGKASVALRTAARRVQWKGIPQTSDWAACQCYDREAEGRICLRHAAVIPDILSIEGEYTSGWRI